MITSKIEWITPAIAEALLLSNSENRRVSDIIVGQYTSDMLSGNWKLTGQPIIIAEDGSLNDGQHRLLAVVASGVPLQAMVVRGVARDTRSAIDTGKPRTSGDILQMFHIPDGNMVASLTKTVIGWERAKGEFLGAGNRVSKTDVIARAQTDPRLSEACRSANATKTFIQKKHAAFARYVIPDSPRADMFFARLADGENLSANDPVLTVRNWFLRAGKRIPDASAVEALLRAWCAYRDRRPLSVIKILGALPKP